MALLGSGLSHPQHDPLNLGPMRSPLPIKRRFTSGGIIASDMTSRDEFLGSQPTDDAQD
jgi:hypothetical protein